MRLILVRHGDAHAGFHGVIGGPRGCTGLTERGRRQAEALREHLAASGRVRADVLLSSIIPRAIETAEIIAPGLGVETFGRECDLCEVHTGVADGLEWAEWGARYGSFDMEAEPDRVFAPEGESWNSFHERVQDVLERLAREYEGRTVVAVCHAGVIMASLRAHLGIGRPETGVGLAPTNTGLTEWAWEPGSRRWTLHSFNEVSHLFPPFIPRDGRVRRSGGDWTWAVIGFYDPDERDRYGASGRSEVRGQERSHALDSPGEQARHLHLADPELPGDL